MPNTEARGMPHLWLAGILVSVCGFERSAPAPLLFSLRLEGDKLIFERSLPAELPGSPEADTSAPMCCQETS